MSKLIAVREHKAGNRWVTAAPDQRVTPAAGCGGDGVWRQLSVLRPSGTPVLVNGREVKIVGRVAMDMICVDLGPDA